MVAVGGGYPAPTSEQSYQANKSLVDTVIPLGGTLQADGSWLRISNDFVLSLPGWAQAANQQYTPAMNPGHGDTTNLYIVLDNAALQETAADEMIANATTDFDAPWDGIVYDAVGLAVAGYPAKQAIFINLLSQHAQGAGIPFTVACKGQSADGQWDLPLLGSLDVDAVIIYCYDWDQSPYSIGPFWWDDLCVQYALGHVSASRLTLGIPIYCRYWEVAGQAMTHSQATQIAAGAGATVGWIEDHITGLIREKYAGVGAGHLWIEDGGTVRSRLELSNTYGLAGAMLFTPGMEAGSVWPVIAQWKKRLATRLHLVAAQEEEE